MCKFTCIELTPFLLTLKGGDILPAIHALTHAVSASSNAAFKILPATTANHDYQLCSIFARNQCCYKGYGGRLRMQTSLLSHHINFLVVLDATLQFIEIYYNYSTRLNNK